jgi:hypothetical protein
VTSRVDRRIQFSPHFGRSDFEFVAAGRERDDAVEIARRIAPQAVEKFVIVVRDAPLAVDRVEGVGAPVAIGIGGLQELGAVRDVDDFVGLDDEADGLAQAAGKTTPRPRRGAHPHFAVARGHDQRAGRRETDGDDTAAHLGRAQDVFDAVAGADERGEKAEEKQEADGGDHGVGFPKRVSIVKAPVASRVSAAAG